MPFLERILLPVDFSARTLGAAHYIEALADRERTEIHLLHVSTPLSCEMSALDVGGTLVSDLNLDRSDELRDQLDNYLADELQPFRVHRHLMEGDAAKRIVKFAHDNRVGLIAMPTHGYGIFRRFLLGSVTAKVLHDADCPVWTGVHIEEAPDPEKIRIRKVMAAIDLCPTKARKTLAWASRFADSYGAELVMAHAHPSLEGRTGAYFDPHWRDYFAGLARAEIVKMQSELGLKSLMVFEGGDIPATVCNMALKEKADVLVIGRGSAAGVFGRLRANAYSIIRQSACPVISV